MHAVKTFTFHVLIISVFDICLLFDTPVILLVLTLHFEHWYRNIRIVLL